MFVYLFSDFYNLFIWHISEPGEIKLDTATRAVDSFWYVYIQPTFTAVTKEVGREVTYVHSAAANLPSTLSRSLP